MKESESTNTPDFDNFWDFEEKLTDEKIAGMQALLDASYFLKTLTEQENMTYKDSDMRVQKIDLRPCLVTVLLSIAHKARLSLAKEVDLGKKFEMEQMWASHFRKTNKLKEIE